MAKKNGKVALITDSTCNIPPELISRYDILVVPAHIIWGTEDQRDQIDITTAQFYERLAKNAVHPTTSQPVSGEVREAIAGAAKAGASEALMLTISGEMSGTFSSAQQAADDASIPVRVFDSRSTGMGLGWQVLAAARAQEAGADAEAMIKAAAQVRDTVAMMIVVGTLEYLRKGGRIGGAQALVGMALDVKPRLVLDTKTGRVEVGDRTRTRAKAIEAMYTSFFKTLDTTRPLHIGVHHAAAPDEGKAMAARIRADYPTAELVEVEMTPVLGAHTGPGTVALAGYNE